MAEGKEGVGTAAARQGLKSTPEGMREVKRICPKRGERRVKRLDSGAEMEERGDDVCYVPRMVVVKKLQFVKAQLNKTKKDHYSVMKSLQLTQKELKWLWAKFEEHDVLNESLQKVAVGRKRRGVGQKRGPKKSRNGGGTRFMSKIAFIALHGLYTNEYYDSTGVCKVADI